MNKKLREAIKEKAENSCKICGHWCYRGSPHHVIKRSEEPLLTNCETNVWWVCDTCHTRTENEAGYNKSLQKELQDYYYSLFSVNKYYTKNEIIKIVNMPIGDLETAIYKGFLKSFKGVDIVSFLMGGKEID